MLRSQDFGDSSPPVREGPRVRPDREMDGLPKPRRYWAIAAISFYVFAIAAGLSLLRQEEEVTATGLAAAAALGQVGTMAGTAGTGSPASAGGETARQNN